MTNVNYSLSHGSQFSIYYRLKVSNPQSTMYKGMTVTAKPIYNNNILTAKDIDTAAIDFVLGLADDSSSNGYSSPDNQLKTSCHGFVLVNKPASDEFNNNGNNKAIDVGLWDRRKVKQDLLTPTSPPSLAMPSSDNSAISLKKETSTPTSATSTIPLSTALSPSYPESYLEQTKTSAEISNSQLQLPPPQHQQQEPASAYWNFNSTPNSLLGSQSKSEYSYIPATTTPQYYNPAYQLPSPQGHHPLYNYTTAPVTSNQSIYLDGSGGKLNTSYEYQQRLPLLGQQQLPGLGYTYTPAQPSVMAPHQHHTHHQYYVQANAKNYNLAKRKFQYGTSSSTSSMKSGKYVCTECHVSESPEWRKGPKGPKTLCNACGLRWAKKTRKESMQQQQQQQQLSLNK